jgi:hypothetical protein
MLLRRKWKAEGKGRGKGRAGDSVVRGGEATIE